MESWARAWRTLVRGWPTLAGLPLLGAILGWLFSSWSPAAYTAASRIFLRENPFPLAGELPPSLAAAGSPRSAPSFLLGDEVLQRAVREHLAGFLPSSPPDRLSESVHFLRSRLSARLEEGGSILIVSCTDESPRRAAAMANAAARAFAPAAEERLRREIKAAAASLEAALRDRDQEDRKLAQELAGLGPETPSEAERVEKALEEEIETLGRRLTTARLESASRAVELDLLLERLERGEFGPLPAPEGSETEPLGRELEAALRELDRIRAERPEDAPALAAASDRVEQLRRRRAEAMERELQRSRFAPVRALLDQIRERTGRREQLLSGARDLQIRLDRAGQRLKEHREAIPAEARAEALERSRKRRRLEEERTRLEIAVRDLKDQRTRIEAAQKALGSPVERVETAVAAVPLPGSPLRGIPWGILLGAALGMPLAWFHGRSTGVLRTEADVRRIVNLPLLGIVPDAGDESPSLIQAPPDSGLSETWQTAATVLEGLARRAGAKVLLVTSPGPGEGKSTAAGNLAVALARSGAKTLLVEADLRRPVQHQVFNLPEEASQAGFSALLQGTAPSVDAVIASTGIEALDLLPAGPYPGPTAALLRAKRLDTVLAPVRGKYEYILVDAPPVEGSADTLLLVPGVEAVLMVLASGETRKDGVTAAKRLLQASGARILGCLLNRAADLSRGYYSYSPYSPVEPQPG